MPHAIRAKVRKLLLRLEDEVRYLRADLEVIQSLFQRSDIPQGRALRLGNGALMNIEDFERYVRLSDQMFDRLKRINRTTLGLERMAARLPWVEQREPAQLVDDAIQALERILSSRNLTVEQGWNDLRVVILRLEDLSRNVQGQLL